MEAIRRRLRAIEPVVSNFITIVNYTSINCSQYIYNSDVYKYAIPVSVMTYFFVYDKMNKNFISRIYQSDKYGIVITYAVLLSLRTYDFITSTNNLLRIEKRESVLKTGKIPTRYGDTKMTLIAQQRAMFLIAVARILAFNMIFNNHTSTEKPHQLAHLIFIFTYGSISIPWHIIYSGYTPNKYLYLIKRISCGLIYWLLFQKIGDWADMIQDHSNILLPIMSIANISKKSVLNMATAFFESLLIAETI